MINSKLCLLLAMWFTVSLSLIAIYNGEYEKLEFTSYLFVGNFWVLMICNSIEKIKKAK